jgi:hypothetical protein
VQISLHAIRITVNSNSVTSSVVLQIQATFILTLQEVYFTAWKCPIQVLKVCLAFRVHPSSCLPQGNVGFIMEREIGTGSQQSPSVCRTWEIPSYSRPLCTISLHRLSVCISEFSFFQRFLYRSKLIFYTDISTSVTSIKMLLVGC